MGAAVDLLIHEATFEDGMEADAVLKRHSTVGEALQIGFKMNAKAVVLTHFSQRYPKIPPIGAAAAADDDDDDDDDDDKSDGGVVGENGNDKKNTMPVAVAFDFMVLTPQNLTLASKMTSTLRLLYPDTSSSSSSSDDDDDDETKMNEDNNQNDAMIAEKDRVHNNSLGLSPLTSVELAPSSLVTTTTTTTTTRTTTRVATPLTAA